MRMHTMMMVLPSFMAIFLLTHIGGQEPTPPTTIQATMPHRVTAKVNSTIHLTAKTSRPLNKNEMVWWVSRDPSVVAVRSERDLIMPTTNSRIGNLWSKPTGRGGEMKAIWHGKTTVCATLMKAKVVTDTSDYTKLRKRPLRKTQSLGFSALGDTVWVFTGQGVETCSTVTVVK